MLLMDQIKTKAIYLERHNLKLEFMIFFLNIQVLVISDTYFQCDFCPYFCIYIIHYLTGKKVVPLF